MPPIIVAKNLSKVYGEGRERVEALKNISLEIEERSIAVLLGPNGSGKSTFMKIAVGILVPTKGELLVLGKKPYSDFEVRGKISYMPQDAGLYSLLTGYENYMFYASLQDVDKKEALERLSLLREELGLEDWFFRRKVSTYSGGMKRKTSLAVALSSDPDLLVLDEPTTGLDPSSRRMFWRILERLKRRGKTILMATHLFEDAEYLADEIIVMHRGRLVAKGSPEELKRKVGYRFAVDVEFMEEPKKSVVKRLRIPGTEIIPSGGFRLTIVGNDSDLISEVDRALEGVRILSLNMRRISLGDVYFLLTGVRLE